VASRQVTAGERATAKNIYPGNRMKLSVTESLTLLDEKKALFLNLFSHGSLEVEIYRPREVDLQQPHARDELYVIATGQSRFMLGGGEHTVVAGDVLFVPAHTEHRFVQFSEDFSTWVFFYGPAGGEAAMAAK
jgi:mannose-6-phosphate isomerase-like protein (cupin superfamily)